MSIPIDLTGKSALVTGAGAGIGLGCARSLAAAGARVFVNDKDGAAAESAAREIGRAGCQAMPLVADISMADEVNALFETIQSDGGLLHILVNNAGFNLFKGLADTTPEEWDSIHRVDLRGVYLVTRAALPLLTSSAPASIINIASVHAELTVGNLNAYAAAKGGVVAMGRSLCQELGPRGIRVNTVSPGFIETPLMDRWLAGLTDADETVKKVLGYHPLGRIGTPADIGELVAFLASPLSQFINGQNITIDGGLTSRLMH